MKTMNNRGVALATGILCLWLSWGCSSSVIVAGQSTLPGHASIQNFEMGVNPGYYPKNLDFSQGTYWSDQALGDLVQKTGFDTFRPALFASLFSSNSPQVKVPEFEHYKSIGLKDVTLFISGGWEIFGDQGHDRENKNYGCSESSKSFEGIYDAVYTADQKVNPANRFAMFIKNVLDNYGDKVKILEIWNEPDLSTSDLLGHQYDYGGNLQSDSWWTRDPKPCELLNLYAPPYHYIRMLRIAYTMVQQYNQGKSDQDKLLVATGGLGYASFLKYILEHTDNPDNGKVSPDYPSKGGEYFDILSFHSYPFFMNYVPDLSKGINVVKPEGTNWRPYARYSDNLKNHPVYLLQAMRKQLTAAGYDGNARLKKTEILTELGMHDVAWKMGNTDYSSSVPLQINTMIKALVSVRKEGVQQVHVYKLGCDIDPGSPLQNDGWSEYSGGLWASFGIYDNLTKKAPGQEVLTPLGTAVKQFADELKGFSFSDSSTAALALPSSMEGAVFEKNGQRKIILWAKTQADESEAASATYAIPSTVFPGAANVKKIQFNGSNSTVDPSATISFTDGAPVLLYKS